MTLIEGVGDEVIQFFGLAIFIALGILAWWSTNISEIPHIRTVLIVERRTTQEVPAQEQSSSSEPAAGDSLGRSPGDESLCQRNEETENAKEQVLTEKRPDQVKTQNNERPPATNPNTSPPETTNNVASEPSPRRNSSVRLNDNNSEADETGNIRIRLKYLNDNQKLVEGRPQELLGDFKRRHFSLELDARKLVRLIFNGQVLHRDEETLAGCGLYDNCVVHCLVHAARNAEDGPRPARHSAPPPDWNLGGLLYFSISLALGLAWVCRYNYAYLFTVPTTTALVGLTVLFCVAVYGIYWHQPQPTQSA